MFIFQWELVEESNQDALRDRKAHGSQEQEVFPFLFKLGKVSDCLSVARHGNVIFKVIILTYMSLPLN